MAIFANASDVVLNPRGWKVGDSRSYKCVTVDKQGNIVNHDISMKVNSMNDDKYFIDCKHVTDTMSKPYLGIKNLLGEKKNEKNHRTASRPGYGLYPGCLRHR